MMASTMVAAVVLSHGRSIQQVAAQTSHMSHSPAEVVQKYVLLDNKGVLCRMEGRAAVGKGDRHQWLSVPDDYRKWQIITPLEVVIPVEFKVLGAVYLDTAGFVPDPSVEEVRVKVKIFNSRWKIVDPMFPPHVGQRRMVNFVRQAMQEEKSETRREILAALQNELRKAK
jgi:hypothetical protein